MSGIVKHREVTPLASGCRVSGFKIAFPALICLRAPVLRPLPIQALLLHRRLAVGATAFVHEDNVEPEPVSLREYLREFADLGAAIVEVRGIHAHRLPCRLEIFPAPTAELAVWSYLAPFGMKKRRALI